MGGDGTDNIDNTDEPDEPDSIGSTGSTDAENAENADGTGSADGTRSTGSTDDTDNAADTGSTGSTGSTDETGSVDGPDRGDSVGGDETVEVTAPRAAEQETPEAWAGEPHAPEPRSAELAGTARSVPAAVLLNLTGIGLGYAYLRCRLRATACAVIVVLMVVVAFANDASSDPWLWRVLAATWAAGTAFDAWWVARGCPRPQVRGEWLRPVLAGGLAVVVVVVGHLGYAQAARATYAAGVAEQGRGACVEANRAFDVVTGPFELTLSRDVPAAAQRRAECTEFLAAERAESAGAHPDAVAGYQAFRRDHPGSLLEGFAREGTRRVLRAWAVELRSSGDLDGAIARYRDLLRELDADPAVAQVREDLAATYFERAEAARRTMAAATGEARVEALSAAMEDLLRLGRELPETAAGAAAPQVILDTFAQANSMVAEGRFCEALPVLDYAVTLPDSAGIAEVAHADRARSLTECGLSTFRSGDLDGAASRFSTLVNEYPDDPGVPQARSALITAEVGRSARVPLPLPAPIDARGSEPVLLYNATSTEVRVLLTGPTAHEVTLPGCIGCPDVYEGGESCPGAEGKPSATVRMRPGPYYLLQDRVDPASDESVNEPITVEPGGGTLCVTVRAGG